MKPDGSGARGAPGSTLLAEIREQPAALSRLLDQSAHVRRLGERLATRPPRMVRMVAHGSFDNAASYGVYAFGLLPGSTAFRDSISLSVYYGAESDLSDSLVIALSQSGQTPDVVSYLENARERGALTVAVTNDPESHLAAAADEVLPLCADAELGIAATKTYMNELATLALLTASAAGRGDAMAAKLGGVVGLLSDTIDSLEHLVCAMAVPFAFVGRMFLIGRGTEFATAREIGLKLLETCRVVAEPLTATALAHGPVAALDPLFPVWAIASDEPSFEAVATAVRRVREAGATLVASGSAAAALGGADYYLPTPEAPMELLSPLLSVVPGQLFAWALAQAKGFNPDEPRLLTKVTLAP